jgi:thioredoxin-like negative regulator of GroEL
MAAQLNNVGLLPDFIAKRLGLQSEKESCAESDGSCCAPEKQRRRRTARESSTASTAGTIDENNENEKKEDNNSNSNDSISGGGEVEHIDTLTRWSEVFSQCKQQSSSSSTLLFVKFTAEWCKPCRVIQPTYVSLAAQYPKYKFVTVDVDGDDCDVLSSKLRVAMMPTFVCFRNGVEVGRMSGGNNAGGLKSWVEKMSS